MFLFGVWYEQLHYDVKDKRFSLIYFRCVKALLPEAPGCKRFNRWEVLVAGEELISFPRLLKPIKDHLSLR